MVVTAFLSMWISNTAATAMMVPIAQAVLMELKAHRTGITTDTKEINDNMEKIEMEEQVNTRY